MQKWLLYGTALALLTLSLVTGVGFYRKSQYDADEPGFGAGALDFERALHLSYDENPLFSETDASPLYGSSHASSLASLMSQQGWVAVVFTGFAVAISLIYCTARSNPEPED